MGFVAWQAWWLTSPMEYQVVRRVGPISLVFTQGRAPIRAVGAIQGFQPHGGKHQLPQFPLPLGFFSPSVCSRPFPSAHRVPLVIPTDSTLNHQPIQSFRVPHILKKKPRPLRPLPGLPLASSLSQHPLPVSRGPTPPASEHPL